MNRERRKSAFQNQPFPAVLAVCLAVFLMVVPSCSSLEEEDDVETQPLKTFSADSFHQQKEKPKCKFLLDSYCNYLYSPEVLGNLEVKRGKGSRSNTRVLQGETVNEFTQVFFQYSKAKIRNQRFLPRDFYRSLVQDGYFSKLQEFLSRKSRKSMSIANRMQIEKIDYELGSIWSASINETILTRMILKFPGYHQISDRMMPIELSLENRRIRRNLISEISRAIWRDDANWKKVELGFQRLQSSYIRMIGKLDVPSSIKSEWSKRISDIKIILPGSIPAISNEECSSTTVNAYYYSHLNVLTVCAGDFNSEDIIQTVAHEMGHALAIDRSHYLFQQNSAFGKALGTLRTNVCEPKKFSCDQWQQYKAKFDPLLKSLDGFRPEVPEFQSCLRRHAVSKTLEAPDIERFSRSIIKDRISSLASSDRFLRITKSEVPMRSGKPQKNPNYLNPCAYYMWSQGEEPIDDELTTLVYFTAEYRCSAHKPPAERLKNSIDLAKQLSTQILEKSIEIEGAYSSRDQLELEGYASTNSERFADVIGSYAMAELLLEIPDKWDRQNKFLASSSWQCSEPSLASHFPEESAIEKEYSSDDHTEGDLRRKELLSFPIREAIACEKDFEVKECSLKFR